MATINNIQLLYTNNMSPILSTKGKISTITHLNSAQVWKKLNHLTVVFRHVTKKSPSKATYPFICVAAMTRTVRVYFQRGSIHFHQQQEFIMTLRCLSPKNHLYENGCTKPRL